MFYQGLLTSLLWFLLFLFDGPTVHVPNLLTSVRQGNNNVMIVSYLIIPLPPTDYANGGTSVDGNGAQTFKRFKPVDDQQEQTAVVSVPS